MGAAQRAGIQNVGMITDPLAAPRRNGKGDGKGEAGR
jgi:hypothetical protein